MEIDNLLQENGNFTLVMKNTKRTQQKKILAILYSYINIYVKLYV